MKVSVNDIELFTLSDIQKQVICNDIDANILDDDLKRRIHYIINHKYNRCFERLKKEWEKKLIAKGMASLPTDPDAFAQLVFSQPDYKDRATRELEAKNG